MAEMWREVMAKCPLMSVKCQTQLLPLAQNPQRPTLNRLAIGQLTKPAGLEGQKAQVNPGNTQEVQGPGDRLTVTLLTG
jgi:hypothetical protein